MLGLLNSAEISWGSLFFCPSRSPRVVVLSLLSFFLSTLPEAHTKACVVLLTACRIPNWNQWFEE